MINKIMTLAEAAKFLRVAPVTLYRKAKSGEVPAAKLGRSWRFHREQLEDRIKNPPSDSAHSPSDPDFRHLSTRETEVVLGFAHEIRKNTKVEKIILYGSRARGDFREDSDIDLAVILNAPDPRLKESILQKARQQSFEKGVLLQVLIFSDREWKDPSFKTFLLVEKMKREGIAIYESKRGSFLRRPTRF